MIAATVIRDSISPTGVRLTTLECTYPRFIHAEVMTHRMFSRNAASSRAIPVRKMVERVRTNMAFPLFWAKNEKGMTAHTEIEGSTKLACVARWLEDAERACESAEFYASKGVHKQIANRPLEPYQHITTIVTATQWVNFESLRCHPAAQQEFQRLATEMHWAMSVSQPAPVGYGEWHLPYEHPEDRVFGKTGQIKLCVARCARVSLVNQNGVYDPKDDFDLYERLLSEHPPHTSPFEHVATPLASAHERSANFKGWRQWRAIVEAERGIDSTA